MKFFEDFEENRKYIKSVFKNCDDIVFKDFSAAGKNCFMVYTDNIVDGETIENAILTNLMFRFEGGDKEALEERGIAVGEVEKAASFEEAIDAVLLGDTAVFFENTAFIVSTKGWPSRGVPETETEMTVYGSKDAFTEQASTNTVLIRRRIRDTALKVKRIKCGRRSRTDIALMYMEGIAREDVVYSVLEKINSLDVDMIIDSGYLEQLMLGRKLSPFPQMQLTERPDKAAASLYEGRVVVVVDNSPFVIIVPAVLNVFFQAAEDYYENWQTASFLRFLRFLAGFGAAFLPGLYIALTVFRPDIIPSSLALKIAAGRGNVPFPTIAEVFIMEIAFELLREAGVRLPSPVSSAIGIVGGIVVGQAAVDAGIVGSAVVIVVALGGICSFVVPNTAMVSALRMVKYFMIILCSFLGIFGFWASILFLTAHLCRLKSFGFPYLYPFCGGSQNDYTDFKDSIIRMPIYLMKKRPVFAQKSQTVRMKVKK